MGAIISDCGKYRYVLTRDIPCLLRWNRPCLFIMLNPSTADATMDDPTIRRCMGFAKSEGAAELTVVNLFALRATDPKELWKHPAPVGPDNDRHIKEQLAAHRIGVVIAAWGAHKKAAARAKAVIQMAVDAGVEMQCLGVSADGSPRHPLYLPNASSAHPIGDSGKP